MNRVAQEVADLGFRVFTRAGGDTYAYFTDGQHIGYVQRHEYRGYDIGSVHKPNQKVGTGFSIRQGVTVLTPAILTEAFCVAPQWAYIQDRNAVEKYRSLDEFLKAPHQAWGGGLREWTAVDPNDGTPDDDGRAWEVAMTP